MLGEECSRKEAGQAIPRFEKYGTARCARPAYPAFAKVQHRIEDGTEPARLREPS